MYLKTGHVAHPAAHGLRRAAGSNADKLRGGSKPQEKPHQLSLAFGFTAISFPDPIRLPRLIHFAYVHDHAMHLLSSQEENS